MSNIDDTDKSENRIFKSDLRGFIGKPFVTRGLTLILCQRGCAVLSIDFKHLPFRKGDIAIIHDLMSFIPIGVSSEFEATILTVTSAACEQLDYNITDNRFWDYLQAYPICHTNAEQYRSVCNWFTLMNDALHRCDKEFIEKVVSGNIYTFFLMFQSEVKPFLAQVDKWSIAKGHATNLLNNFYSLVVRHHRKHREVAYYANLLSITPDYLNKLSVQHWKISAKEFINYQMVMAIKNYLACTDLSIKCIAAQLNFDDSSYMCRFFKKQTGMSPVEYRDNMK